MTEEQSIKQQELATRILQLMKQTMELMHEVGETQFADYFDTATAKGHLTIGFSTATKALVAPYCANSKILERQTDIKS